MCIRRSFEEFAMSGFYRRGGIYRKTNAIEVIMFIIVLGTLVAIGLFIMFDLLK